ncbi:MAG: MFS transporter [Actinomycetota bacterium]
MKTERTPRARTQPRIAVRRLALARSISLTGSGAAFTALAYIIFRRTGESATWVSAALLVTFGASGLFTPLAGALGDRLDRRRVLIGSDLLGAVGFLVLAFARTPTQMLVVAFATAVVETPFFPVSRAAIPNLIGEEDLSWANGMVSIGVNLGFFVGPLLGGGLVGILAGDNTAAELRVAGYWVYGLNAVSFVVSALIVRSIRAPFSQARVEGGDEYRGLRAGVVFLAREPVLRIITLAWVVLLLGAGFTLVAEVALADLFGTGSTGYGALTALWGGGAALGSLLGARYLNAAREPWSLLFGTVVIGLGIGLTSIAPWFAAALVLTLAAGIGEGFTHVAETGIVQRRAPDAVRARVMGASDAAVLIAFAASFTFGGLLVEAIGARGAYAIGGLSCLVASAVLIPAVRRLVREQRTTSVG